MKYNNKSCFVFFLDFFKPRFPKKTKNKKNLFFMHKDLIYKEVPAEWRAAVMALKKYERPYPEGIPDKVVIPKKERFTEILNNDPTLKTTPMSMDKSQKLLEAAKLLKEQIHACKVQLQKAEEKRRAIAASAELIHGECDSQLSSEQHLDIFVRSIDSILPYYENLEKITMDLKSPLFSVLSPDFAASIKSIDNGIRFFDLNSRFKDSRSFLLKYQALQNKITEMIRDHIARTFRMMSRFFLTTNKTIDDQYKNDIYIKFKSEPGRIMNFYKMCEKTPVFPELLNIYKDARIKLLQPILQIPISDITDIRPRATMAISFCFKEYDLSQSYFQYDSHPMYAKCFGELVDSIGALFYESCATTIIKTTDIKQLCDACIVLKGDNLQDEITRIPLAAEKLRFHFSKLLSSVQERLLIRTELFSKEISEKPDLASIKTIDVLSMLYYALPAESFGETACNLLSICLQTINDASKKFKDDQIELDSYKLSHYLALRDQLTHFDAQLIGTSQVIDYEPIKEFLSRLLRFDSSAYNLNGERGFLQSVASLTRVVSSTVDARAQLESATSLTFKSLTANATQLLVQPLLNLKARQGKEKNQILQAIEGVKSILKEHFDADISSKVKAHIKIDEHRKAVLDVLREQLIQVLNDCKQSFDELDEETQNAINQLQNDINELSF